MEWEVCGDVNTEKSAVVLLELIRANAKQLNDGTLTLVFQDANLIQLNKKEIIKMEDIKGGEVKL